MKSKKYKPGDRVTIGINYSFGMIETFKATLIKQAWVGQDDNVIWDIETDHPPKKRQANEAWFVSNGLDRVLDEIV